MHPFTAQVAGSKLSGIMVLLFGIMGIVGSSAALNWSRTCEGAKVTLRAYSAVSLIISFSPFWLDYLCYGLVVPGLNESNS